MNFTCFYNNSHNSNFSKHFLENKHPIDTLTNLWKSFIPEGKIYILVQLIILHLWRKNEQ